MNGIFRHERHSRSWGEIAADFFMTVKNNMSAAVVEQQNRVVKKLVAVVLLSVGAVFFLVGLSILIGMIINQTSWPGYMIVGIVLALGGLLITKK